VLGPAFAFAGVVFVDRADSELAVRALTPALDALSSGLSLAMAPEGTRSRGAVVGPFKKGAFRIALAARVPVVPIVIHNARDVLPRGAWIMTSAVVRVSVLPPVETHDWALDHLDTHIQAVRALYETTLGTSQEPATNGTPPARER
jgi:putative phosphoserine phosphatase/1-acylglycerol-3-phosphate O-acyltransferase